MRSLFLVLTLLLLALPASAGEYGNGSGVVDSSGGGVTEANMDTLIGASGTDAGVVTRASDGSYFLTTITDLDALPAASAFATNTKFLCRENGESVDNACTGAQIRAGLITTANQLTVNAAGTVYSLTATSAAVDFGTTDPALTLTAAGTYLLVTDCVLRLNGATFAADRTVTMKLRRTNNTAADVTGGSRSYDTGTTTTITASLVHFNASAIYTTANADDSVTIFGDVSVVPTVGSLDVASCALRAVRLQQ